MVLCPTHTCQTTQNLHRLKPSSKELRKQIWLMRGRQVGFLEPGKDGGRLCIAAGTQAGAGGPPVAYPEPSYTPCLSPLSPRADQHKLTSILDPGGLFLDGQSQRVLSLFHPSTDELSTCSLQGTGSILFETEILLVSRAGEG